MEVYPGPTNNNTYQSNLYSVSVFDGSLWQPSYTYKFSRTSVEPWHQGASPSVNFTTFATASSSNVQITNLSGNITSISISPLSKSITAAISGNRATLTLNQNNKVWITINGDDSDPLFIFADAPKPVIPTSCPGLVYFGPGVTTIDQFQATSNQVIYIDGGAWVRGNINISGTQNVQIAGPGVLSGDLWTAETVQSLPFAQETKYAMITGDWGGRNMALVSDITIVDSPFYNFYSGASNVESIKILSPWYWSTDGFEGVNHVDQTFVFNGDNVFFPTWAGINQDNVTVTNSFAGNTGNAVFCRRFLG